MWWGQHSGYEILQISIAAFDCSIFAFTPLSASMQHAENLLGMSVAQFVLHLEEIVNVGFWRWVVTVFNETLWEYGP